MQRAIFCAIQLAQQLLAECVGRPLPEDTPVLQGNDAIKIALQQVERVQVDEQRGSVASCQVAQQPNDFLAETKIERADGFIGKYQSRLLHDKTRHRYALLLSAGKFVRQRPQPLGELDLGEGGPREAYLLRPQQGTQCPRK